MWRLLLSALLLAGCTKEVEVTKYVTLIKPKQIYKTCFKYPTHSGYVFEGQVQDDFNNKVFIVIMAEPSHHSSESYMENDIKVVVYGYNVWISGDFKHRDWMPAPAIDKLEEVDCKNWGKVYKRE